jgi:hypothetical protein
MKTNLKVYTLTGAGTEIANFNVADTFEKYIIKGSATSIGNYAISITGTPQAGETFIVKYKGVLDITTNGNTFSILGQSLTQNQLISDLDIEAYYDGSAWIVEIKPSFTSAVVEAANLIANSVGTTQLANGSVTNPKLATNSITTVKITDLNVTTGKIADLGVTDAKINDVNGSKITSSTVTNAKLATMADQTVKGNISGGSANPSDIPLSTLVNASSWGLTGNSGTTAGTNFIGTTDNVDLVFKVNSIESGRINISENNTSFGRQSLLSFSGGIYNAAFGRQSLQNTSTGDYNVGLGNLTLTTNTSGSRNTAVGHTSTYNLASGSGNTGIGASSLLNLATGDNNIALGSTAGGTLTTGNSNTFIGSLADTDDAASSNRIALGYGAEADADFQFALPDNVTKVKWRGVTYTLPSADGTAGQTLKTMGDGTLYWG